MAAEAPLPAADGPAFDAAALERARLLFTQACQFVIGARTEEQLPPPGRLEVAVAGRSNVGKSSLINALTGHRRLARISNTPGRTQEVNFFDLGGVMYLVDLPGYGYARAAKSEIKRWNRLIDDYLKGRPSLHRAMLLIDARRGVTDADRSVMRRLDTAAVSYQTVLTKTDKLKPAALEHVAAAVGRELRRHGAAHPDILRVSAMKGHGIAELRAVIAAMVATP